MLDFIRFNFLKHFKILQIFELIGNRNRMNRIVLEGRPSFFEG